MPGTEIDWGLTQNQPNFAGGLLDSFQAGRQLALQQRGDNALAKVRANPDDQSALTDLAIYKPEAANAFLSVQNVHRAAQARAAAAGVFQAAAYPGQQQPAAPPSPMRQPTMDDIGRDIGALPQPAPPAPQAPQAAQQPAMEPGKVPPQALLQPDHPVTQAVGAAVAQGQLDLPHAIATFAQYADPEQTAQMIQAVGQMDDMHRLRAADSNKALGGEAQALLAVPENQRMQVAMAALPQLAQHGVTAEMIQGADLSDNGLHGIIGSSIGAQGIFDEAAKTKELGQTDTQLQQGQQRIGIEQQQTNEAMRHNRVEESKGVTTPFGDIVNPITGQKVYDAYSGSGGDTFSRMISAESGGHQFSANGQPTTSSKGAVGIAQVMPGTGPQAAALAGVPWDPQKYANDPAYNATIGRAYFQSLVQHYGGDEAKAVAAYNAGPGNAKKGTGVDGAIAKANSSGNPGNWQQYLPKETQGYLAKVMTPSSGGSGGAIESNAQMIANYQMPPPTQRAGETPMGIMVMHRVQQLNPTYDGTRFAERSGAMKAWGYGNRGTELRSKNVALDHIDALQNAAQALQNGRLPVFNAIANSLATMTGHAPPTTFAALKSLVADEVTKGAIGTAGGVGDRAKVDAAISAASSPEQLAGLIYGWKGLIGDQIGALRRQFMSDTGLGSDAFDAKLSTRAQQILRIYQQQGQTGAAGMGGIPPDVAAIMAKYGAH